jgi:hypothetical protein
LRLRFSVRRLCRGLVFVVCSLHRGRYSFAGREVNNRKLNIRGTLLTVPTAVAMQSLIGALPRAELHPALVNGAAGVVITVRGRPFAIMGFTVTNGKIIEIDAIADPHRIQRIAASILDKPQSSPTGAIVPTLDFLRSRGG